MGELTKEILKADDYGAGRWQASPALEEELGDCLFSLLALGGALGLDAEKALMAALEKYARRVEERGSAGSGR